MVARVNSENVDLVVLLGDYVSQFHSTVPIAEQDLRMPVSDVADNIAGMKARYGVVAVLGKPPKLSELRQCLAECAGELATQGGAT